MSRWGNDIDWENNRFGQPSRWNVRPAWWSVRLAWDGVRELDGYVFFHLALFLQLSLVKGSVVSWGWIMIWGDDLHHFCYGAFESSLSSYYWCQLCVLIIMTYECNNWHSWVDSQHRRVYLFFESLFIPFRSGASFLWRFSCCLPWWFCRINSSKYCTTTVPHVSGNRHAQIVRSRLPIITQSRLIEAVLPPMDSLYSL